MQTKKAKLIATKGGSGSSTFRVAVPTRWIRGMGLGEETKNLKLEFDGNKIIITNNEEEATMLNKLLEVAKIEIVREMNEVGFIDDSDNTDRFLDDLARSLTEKEILKDNDDIELYYEKESEIEEIAEEVLEMIKDFMGKKYKNKGETDEKANYTGVYYEDQEGLKKWKEIIAINE